MAKTKQKELGHGLGVVCGTTVVGERGQLVIPKEAREKLKTSIASRALLCYYNKVAAERGCDKKYQVKDILTRRNKRVSI